MQKRLTLADLRVITVTPINIKGLPQYRDRAMIYLMPDAGVRLVECRELLGGDILLSFGG